MSQLDQVREGVLAHAFHQQCELELLKAGEGRASTRFAVNDFTANPQGALHGGILYAMLDVSCFFAVVSVLEPDRHPVSIEVHTSVLRAATREDRVRIDAWTDRVGGRVASMRAEAWAENDAGERLIATGTVTKSLISG